ncbi:hypothetical protein ACOMHN_043376 [Nucella lapillus]
MVGSGGVKTESNDDRAGSTGNGYPADLRDKRWPKGRQSNSSSENGDPYLHTVSLDPGVHRSHRAHRPKGSLPTTPVTLSRGSLYTASHDSAVDSGFKSSKQPLYGEDENADRGNWSGRFDFILSMLGYAVGLGNIWRFPYLCYRNGGGAFLLPFLLMMGVIGLPVFYLEASLGQFCSNGPMGCWQFAPLFKGLGLSMVAVSGLTAVYYNMILAWSLYYLFASFTSDLPWNTCDGYWNTGNCSLKLPIVGCGDNVRNGDGTCSDATSGEFLGLWNSTLFTAETGRKRVSPSEEYWNGKALAISTGVHDLGQPKWDLSLCLLLAWVIVFLCLLKGIKTTGKVVYFTAIFPYVVLFILLIRGATLENAEEGIYYFIVPDFERLADARVWKDAANQIFFSMSIGGGGLITLSSYNRFHNNILRDSLIVAIGDSLTCVLGGFVIFSFLGYMAGQLDVSVKTVVKDGAGLAFIVYPEAVSSLPPSTLWAILFFLMLITLGLDSQFAMVETVLTGVLDQYPHLRPRKTLIILLICFCFFLLGLPLACPGGMYMLQLMDNYVGGMTLIIIGFIEIIAVIYVYGGDRFCQDIHIMTGSTMFIFWKVTWYALSPLTIGFIFIFMFVDYSPSTYGDYGYPGWADALGWLMAAACVIFIPGVMVYKINRETDAHTLWEKVRLLTLPSELWGPALPKYRQLVTYVKDFEVDPYSKRAREKGAAPPGGGGGVGGFTNLAFTPDTAYSVANGTIRLSEEMEHKELPAPGERKKVGNLRRPKLHYDQHRCLRFNDVFHKAGEKVEAKAAVPKPQMGIKQENDGSYRCKLCARRNLGTIQALESHCKSNKHNTAVQLQKQKEKKAAGKASDAVPQKPTTERLRIESDAFDQKKEEHSKILTLGEANESASTLTYTVTNVSANSKFRFKGWELSTLSQEFHLLDAPSEGTTLGPNMQLKLQMKMAPQKEAVHAFKTVFRFDDLTRNVAVGMSVNVKVAFITKETKELSSTGGYYDSRKKRPPMRAFYRRGAAVAGMPLPSMGDRDQLEKDRSLPWHDMKEHLHRFINEGLIFKGEYTPSQIEELNAHKQALSEEEVTFNNYHTRFSFLLYLEEHQTDVDMESYFMERVRMDRHGHLLSLEVPGLAENRPSVLRGDQMFVRQYLGPGSYEPKEYQGFVHDVQKTRVFLGFSQQLVNRFHGGMEFCARFVLNRLPLRIQHRALTLIDSEESNLENTLFPTDDTARTQGFLLPAETQLRFYSQQPEPNPEQARAIRYMVLGSSRPAPYILFGPPGTGKTFTIVEAIKQVLKNLPEARVLACAPSNSAADIIADKLVDHLQKREVYRMNAFSRGAGSISEKIKDVCNLTPEGETCFPSKQTLAERGVRVYITTLVTAGRLVSAQFDADHFTHLFVDEAGHATEPEAVSALAGLLYMKGDNPVGKQVVLAGDPKQLGPILRSPFAKKFKLDTSLMERLMDLPIYRRRDEPGAQDGLYYDPLLITKLVQNYRSHPTILDVPNELFYNGDLVTSGLPELTHLMCDWEPLPNRQKPLIFHAVIGEDMQEASSPSFFNPFEVRQVMHYVERLVNQTSPRGVPITQDHIGIISPYSKQVQKIRGELKRQGMDKVKVGSVEEFQGQERLIIIVSTVRSNPRFLNTDNKFTIGFLQNNKRFNVAVTRPKALLIVIGNPNVLRHNRSWSTFVEYCKVNGCMMTMIFVEYCKVNGCMVDQHLDRTDDDETFMKLRDLLDELEVEEESEMTAEDLAQVSALNNQQTFHRDL